MCRENIIKDNKLSNVSLYELDYPDDISIKASLFCKWPGFIHLSSSNSRKGRYDIIAFYPSKQLFCQENKESINFFSDALKAMDLSAKNAGLPLPFQGGYIGYISYDLGCIWQGIPLQKERMGTLPLGYLGLYEVAIIVDNKQKSAHLICANRGSQSKGLISEVRAIWNIKTKAQLGMHVDDFKPLLSQNEYRDAFTRIQDDLRQGRCYQVNLSQPFQATYSGDDYAVFQCVLKQNPVPYAAFIQLDNGALMSFSPECFLTAENSIVTTQPIKGTIRRVENEWADAINQQQLLHCQKNRAENVMIVDLLRNDLGRIAKINSIKVPYLCALESYSGLHHLVSEVSAQYDNLSVYDLLQACFPGGSITGAPKLEAMRVIAELERYARGAYCGLVGYYSHHGRFDSNIAIRTFSASAHQLYAAAGGGIVMDSNWQQEYEECFIKIMPLIKGARNGGCSSNCPL